MEKKESVGMRHLPGIGKKAPDFVASSSCGAISFPDQFKGSWVVLFNHVPAFSSISLDNCAQLRALGEEFFKNDCKLIDLLGGDYDGCLQKFDNFRKQTVAMGLRDFEVPLTFVDDRKRDIASAYGMNVGRNGGPDELHSFFVIDPDSMIRTVITYHADSACHIFDGLLRVVIALRKSDSLYPDGATLRIHNRVALGG